MKNKKFYKKLEINKRTIADLSNDEMNEVKGGASKLSICLCEYTAYYTCPPYTLETQCM
ncbi:MAG TPA: class I lanthipeptide [Candidatus Deferrimicrobium sp.]|nr:class I lanthipeptide [Candidatus Kapabacteria bacterium]HLP61827.1 class I lanthipeptide [Candidatus Deferrimicrobium sp.]